MRVRRLSDGCCCRGVTHVLTLMSAAGQQNSMQHAALHMQSHMPSRLCGQEVQDDRS